MLVLTRKLDEQIFIGEDIKVTLLRVRGNTVRIGIEAPRDVRIVRGELGPKVEASADDFSDGGPQLSQREQAFAHQDDDQSKPVAANRLNRLPQPQLFVGTVRKSGKDLRLTRAPLADFVAAS